MPETNIDDVFEKICSAVAEGMIPQKAFKKHKVKRWDFYRYCKENSEAASLYAMAKECYADAQADELGLIADDGLENGLPANSGPAMKAKQWRIEKLAPDTYGDKPMEVNMGMSFYDRMREELMNTPREELEAELPKALVNQMLIK